MGRELMRTPSPEERKVGKQIEYRDAIPVPGAKASRLVTSAAP
jgi:hypothetical protein